jgi:hypothetical protein
MQSSQVQDYIAQWNIEKEVSSAIQAPVLAVSSCFLPACIYAWRRGSNVLCSVALALKGHQGRAALVCPD